MEIYAEWKNINHEIIKIVRLIKSVAAIRYNEIYLMKRKLFIIDVLLIKYIF